MAKKYIFKQLPSGNMVETTVVTSQKDETIDEVVMQHLSKIVENQQEHLVIEANEVNLPDVISQNYLSVSAEELDSIKKLAFENGRKLGLAESEARISEALRENEQEKELINILSSKIDELKEKYDPSEEYLELTASFFEILLDKIITNLPTDFSKLLNNKLEEIIKKNREGNKVTIRVNANQTQLLKKIISSNENTFKNTDIDVIADEEVNENDCIVEYKNAMFVYDRNLQKKEIEELISKFKQD
ncbi:MAG: FliH/SctL family protein [Rickettsiaceae bacterium]|nr:FliH/SctL family protein [Rickettsiaceae bacterium]